MAEVKIRLQKFMAECGVASRRKSEELIAQGRVRVNGKVASVGDSVDPSVDKITVNGRRIVLSKRKVYIMLNKPRGFITTMSDERGRKCVSDLVSDIPERLFPVGRLDRESEGLLIMTNDGEFANAITHPSRHVPKTYRVTVRQNVSGEQQEAFSVGMMLDGKRTLPTDCHIVTREPERTVMELTLYEGRNRQIRRMCEALGLEVLRLKRTKIGNVKLGMLHPGSWRDLTEKEIRHLLDSSETEFNKNKNRI